MTPPTQLTPLIAPPTGLHGAHDLRKVACGMIPHMQSVLEQSVADEVRFLVRAKMVLEITNALGVGGEWEMDVDEVPADAPEAAGSDVPVALLVFRRGGRAEDDPLNLV
ncbi:hypothetical protein dsx2_0022 [Desulfovibrio sp. X2]|uniref:hypothetical protein n=1 Tax=Desulfovibrio sp. X2 TaxID=941449 RepID=UPI000358A8DC|nr:hypothetical protein [Desulfovibrio sp. X2]EPR43798.1 hypothetical protein dsx2_0022 [Desulfovibrio sp. X2]